VAEEEVFRSIITWT